MKTKLYTDKIVFELEIIVPNKTLFNKLFRCTGSYLAKNTFTKELFYKYMNKTKNSEIATFSVKLVCWFRDLDCKDYCLDTKILGDDINVIYLLLPEKSQDSNYLLKGDFILGPDIDSDILLKYYTESKHLCESRYAKTFLYISHYVEDKLL